MEMALFDHEARQFKFDVMVEVSRRSFEGKLNEDTIDEVAEKLIPGKKADFRCCIYKEKEIIRQRTRMAMGKTPTPVENDNPRQIVRVIEAACDGCSIHKIQVTDNCRKCMAKACLSACKFDAIHIGETRAFIDYDKCKECGACKNACPFSAIVETQRPCKKSCPVDAISIGENNIAQIDEEKCIICGACQAKCPFGAIEDMSWMVPVIEELKNKENKFFAIFAPAIQGQYDKATLPQIMESIRQLGFDEVYEAAIGADAVAWYETQDAKKHKAEGVKMTTSCCPAFVNLARQHFPTVYENNVSHMVSPMVATTRYLKKHHPGCKVVFVGPCVAKKQEAQDLGVDFVITFEELGAMFTSRNISPENVEAKDEIPTSMHAREFCIGSGVSKAVLQVLKETGDDPITAEYADGSEACKKALLMMKVNRFQPDVLEGMACVGGCICGPATVENPIKAKAKMKLENKPLAAKTVASTLEVYDFSDIDLHR